MLLIQDVNGIANLRSARTEIRSSMSPESIFQVCSSIAPIGWLLLIIAPRWRWTRQIVISGFIPLLLGIVYTFLILFYFSQSQGNFNSLAGVMTLFTQPYVVVAGWVHYLAFDLFIGTWQVSDSVKHNIPHLLVVPCLVLTFLFGPIGLLLYYLIRSVRTRKMLHENF